MLSILNSNMFRAVSNGMSAATVVQISRRFLSRFCLLHQLKKMKQRENTLFIILMPASIHVAIKSIELVEHQCNIVIIGNGLSHAEKMWLKRNKPKLQFAFVPDKIHHHQVINAVLHNWRINFGILDYDCFVIDSAYSKRMLKLNKNQVVASPFCITYDSLGINLPETFYLYFNINLIHDVMHRYQVDSRIYYWSMLNRKVKKALATMGVSEGNLPEPQKQYFDTLRLIFLLCHFENYDFNFINKYSDAHGESKHVYHIGGISKPHVITDEYSFRGSYFWLKSLEYIDDDVLYNVATKLYGQMSSEKIIEKYPKLYAQLDNDFLDLIERLYDN